MALTDDLLDRTVSHQIGLHRYATGVVRRIVALLDAADADLLAKIERSQTDAGRWTSRRIQVLLVSLREINREAYAAVQRELGDELVSLAHYEEEFQLRMLESTVPVTLDWVRPTRAQLRAVVYSRPFQGSLLREWVAGMEEGRARRLREAVRISYVEGETVAQLVRRVRGTAGQNYRDGILDVSRRSAEGIVRTAVNHVSTQAREVLYEENSDLVKGVGWVSTLDLRTTAVCRARDGEVYPPGKGPRPPAHIRCRSSTVPVVRSWRELGIDLDEAPPGTRASMDGQVSAQTTYGEWLRRRSAAEQDEVLGPTRGRLFRQGGLAVDKFVDSTGHEYSLDELRRREAAAFARAGIEEAA